MTGHHESLEAGLGVMQWTVPLVLHVATSVCLSLFVLLTKRRAVSAVLWTVTVWVFPLIGGLVYLTFGLDRVNRGARDRAQVSRVLARSLPTVGRNASADRDSRMSARPLLAIRGGPSRGIYGATAGNEVDLLVDGDGFYPELLDSIAKAQTSVHVQSYIIAPDAVGARLCETLAARAQAGVDVRLLYDRFGSAPAHYSGFFRDLKRKGVAVSSITQAHPLRGHFQVNLRNHRKVAVVDGCIGFLGGINFAESNVAGPRAAASIRDYHVRVAGPVVRSLQTQFLLDWYFATRESAETLSDPALFPEVSSFGPGVCQLISGGPAPESSTMADVVFDLISRAQRSVVIVTPYFVPDAATLQAIRYAVVSGKEVRLIVPRRGNHFTAEWAGRSLYGGLLEAGVRIFERMPPFLHAKAIVIDGEIVALGSVNMDYRSLFLNFETLLLSKSPSLTEQLTRQIDAELAHCSELTADTHAARSIASKLLENFCFLFQPLL